MGKSDKYITLKEAAEISGYAPDYIGQLIRSGKLEGKQVFSNVAWVTTEDAIREYAERGKKRGKTSEQNHSSPMSWVRERLDFKRLVKTLSYVLIGIGVLFALVLFYIASVSLDRYLQKSAAEKAEERALNVPPLPENDPHVPL